MSNTIASHGYPTGSVFGNIGEIIGTDVGQAYYKQLFDTQNVGWVNPRTPTPTPSPTPTPTPSPTPVPTYPINSQFVFTSCTNNSMIIQYTPVPYNVNVGSLIKDVSGNCYSYVGYYANYSPPTGYIWNIIETFTASTATTYTTCLSCLTPPVTPGPSYKTWYGKSEFTVTCPTCELVNGGSNLTFYTSSGVTTIGENIYVYEDISLETPVLSTYIKYNNKIYSVDQNGKLSEFCTVNGNC